MKNAISGSNKKIPNQQGSHISDVERASLSDTSYPVTPITQVDGNTGNWTTVGDPHELANGLEIYALQKEGTNEVVFTIRGSDTEPDGKSDWGLEGGNSGGGLAGLIAKAVITAANSAAADYVRYARVANNRAMSALPYGRYHAMYQKDMTQQILDQTPPGKDVQ